MNNTDILTFDYAPVGNNGRVRLSAILDDKVLHVDELNIASARQRDGFAARVCKGRDGISRAKVDRELLNIAQKVQAARDKRTDAPASSGELDVSRIVRPERFITPDVSGLTVATPVLRDDKPAGRWMLYLHWADGKREAVELPDSLALPDDGKLWVYPTPGLASISEPPAWTGEARKAWLAGADSPDPAGVFQRLCQRIAYYIDFPEQHALGTTATLALWTMLTYCYPAWPAVPYLYLGGPVGSGKTRVLQVFSRLVFRPLVSSNMTAAALFRTLHSKGGTLLFDEAERLKDTAPDVSEINSMLLAGYQHGGRATRLEPVGDTYKTVEFDVFGPKALACVKGLPPVLLSRCISVMMFRAAKDSEKPRRRIDAYPKRWEKLRSDLHALTLDYGPDIPGLARRTDVCPAMSGRDFEKWQPLLALASWVEDSGANGLLALMQDYAAATIELAAGEQTPDCDEALLRILADAVNIGQQGALTPGELLKRARETTDGATFERWSAKGAANALRRYGIETRKTHGRRAYGHVMLADLRRIETAYNMDLGLPETNNDGDTPGNVPHVPQVHPDYAE